MSIESGNMISEVKYRLNHLEKTVKELQKDCGEKWYSTETH